MLGTILLILLVIFVGIPIGIWILGILAEAGSSTAAYNKKQKELHTLDSVFNAMGLKQAGPIPATITRESFSAGVEKYYQILEESFEYERQGVNKNLFIPTYTLSHNFFECSLLGQSLGTITKDLNYVMDGSGWVQYKKCLEESLPDGKLETLNTGRFAKFRITLNKDLILLIDQNTETSSYSDEISWSIKIMFKGDEVLSGRVDQYGKMNSAYKFKPDLWILDVRILAAQYAYRLSEMKKENSLKSTKDSLFRN